MTYVSYISHFQLQTVVIYFLYILKCQNYIYSQKLVVVEANNFLCSITSKKKKKLFSISGLLALIPHPLYPFMMHRKQPHFNRGARKVWYK